MRKVLLAFALVLASISSNAQKGMSSIGIDAEVTAGMMLAYGFDVKYQYNLFSMGRIEPSFSMSFGEADYRVGLHYHQFLNGIKRNRFYLLLGGGYEATTDYDYDYTNHGGFARGGFGYERKLSHRFSLQTEASALYSSDSSYDDVPSFHFKIGITYNL